MNNRRWSKTGCAGEIVERTEHIECRGAHCWDGVGNELWYEIPSKDSKLLF